MDLYHYPLETLTHLIDHNPQSLHSLFTSTSLPYLTQAIIHLDLVQHANHDAIQAHLANIPIPNPALRARPLSPCYFDLLVRQVGPIDSLTDAVHQFWAQFLSQCEQAQVISSSSVHGHLASGLVRVCTPAVLAHASCDRYIDTISPDRFPIVFATAISPPPHLREQFIHHCYLTKYDEFVAARVISVLARVLGPNLDGLSRFVSGVQRVESRRCLRIAALIVAGQQEAFVINQLIEFLMGQHVEIDDELVANLLINPWTAPLAVEIVANPRFTIGRDFTEEIFAAFRSSPAPMPPPQPCCSWRHDRDHVWTQLRSDASEVIHAQRRLLQCDPNLGDCIAQHILQLLREGVPSSNLVAATANALPDLINISLIREKFWFVVTQIMKFVDDEALIEALMSVTSSLDRAASEPDNTYVNAALQRLLRSRTLLGHIAEHIYELKERYESVTVLCLAHADFCTELVSLIANASDSLLVTNCATLFGVLIHDIVSKRIVVDRQIVRRIARTNFVQVCCKRIFEASNPDDIHMVRALLDCINISVHLTEAEITSNMFCKSGAGPPLLMQVLKSCDEAPYRNDPQLINVQRLLLVAACRNTDSRFVVTFCKSTDSVKRLQALLGDMAAPANRSDLRFLHELIGVELIEDQIRNLPGFKQWLFSFNDDHRDSNLQAVINYFLQSLPT